jgi:antitoxin (DNA-binding transcriptional repressor) of toxin-antitoxin stability system
MYTPTSSTRHLKTVTFTEFRRRASGLFDLVERGETIQVLRHGKVVARIVPPETSLDQPAWKRRGLRLVIPGAKVSQAILDERRSSP